MINRKTSFWTYSLYLFISILKILNKILNIWSVTMSSSSSPIDIIRFVTLKVEIIYFVFTGIFVWLLNIIVFTSLRTFRETRCGTYLMAASIYNFGQSLTLLFRVFNSAFNYGQMSSAGFWSSLFYKYVYVNHGSVLINDKISTPQQYYY